MHFALLFFVRLAYFLCIAALRRDDHISKVCIHSLILFYAHVGNRRIYAFFSRPREVYARILILLEKKRSSTLNYTKGVGFREKLVLSSSIYNSGCCCCFFFFYRSCILRTDMNAYSSSRWRRKNAVYCYAEWILTEIAFV